MCLRTPNYYLINITNGKEIPLNCNTYSCPECGPKKAYKLRKYLQKYLENWKNIRFWTFTLSSESFEDEEDHMRALSECWSRFVTYLRRNKSLYKKQRGFRYVKVYENHKTGYWHLHVCVDQYLPYSVIQPIWEQICQERLGSQNHSGQSWVTGEKSAKTAAYYVSKYVLKSALEIVRMVRRFSTSHGIKIYPEKNSSGDWICVRNDRNLWEQIERLLISTPPLLVVYTSNSTTSGPENPQNSQLLLEFSSE